MKFTTCIVREPCAEMVSGLTTAGLGVPDYPLALRQHRAYVKALEQCACRVITLPADPLHPDSVFVEDPALLIGDTAILTRPGAVSRRGEVSGMRQRLKEQFRVMEEIQAPGTLDGGDVLEVEDHCFIGLSERTNMDGAAQLIRILEKHGKSGSTISLNKFLHLKTGVAYLGNNTLLLAGELKECNEFKQFNRIEVDEEEEYAANSIVINGRVIMPAGFPKTLGMLISSGYKVITVDTSEYRKLDGGLSCLSLRFKKAFQDYYPDDVAHCYGCGYLNEYGHRIKSYWDGEETLAHYNPEPYHTAVPGYVYGGLLASLVDCHSTGTAAAAKYREEKRPMDSLPALRFLTASLRVDYRKPTPLGVPLEIRGKIKEVKGRKVVVEVELKANDEVCVTAEVICIQVPEDFLK